MGVDYINVLTLLEQVYMNYFCKRGRTLYGSVKVTRCPQRVWPCSGRNKLDMNDRHGVLLWTKFLPLNAVLIRTIY